MFLPRWHWMYRDFVANLKESLSNDWVIPCERYVRRNWDLLNKIHFQPKGFASYEQVMDRFLSLGQLRISGLLNNLTSQPTFESTIVSMTDRLLQRLGHQAADQDVYVIVGLDCTNIYSTDYEGRPVTVLCLEATNADLKEVELLLAHEAHHWKRQSMVSHNIFDHSVQERCVTEGLAACFTEEVQPGRDIHEYCFVPPETVAWVQSHLAEMGEMFQRTGGDNTAVMSALFSRYPKTLLIPGMPPRTGYVYGYLLTKAFLKRVQKTSVQMAGVNFQIVYNETGVVGETE